METTAQHSRSERLRLQGNYAWSSAVETKDFLIFVILFKPASLRSPIAGISLLADAGYATTGFDLHQSSYHLA